MLMFIETFAANAPPSWQSGIPRSVLFFLGILLVFSECLLMQLQHHCYRAAEQTAGAYDTLACLENNAEWVWPSVFILNTSQLPECARGGDFLMVTNPFGCPFRRSGFGSSIPEVAPSTEKPHSEKEEMENPYTDIFGCQIELQTPRGKEVLF